MIKATYIDHMGSDLSVVDAARVSFAKHSGHYTKEQNDKLIRYLAKHEHISPFGHAFASFHVRAPIFVARQLVKHKFLRWNEISRRYVDDEPEFYVPDVWRGRSADKKQGSSDTSVDLDAVGLNGVTPPHESGWEASLLESIHEGYSHTLGNYDALIKAGVAPEQARMVLPQSSMTEWYWSGSLDAFASMCELRLKEDTQYESRLVAQQISAKMAQLFPVSWAALMADYTFEKKIEKLEANLAKAVDALGEAIYLLDPDEEDIAKETGLHHIVTTYAELTGGKDE